MSNANLEAISIPNHATSETGLSDDSSTTVPQTLTAADRAELIQRMLRDALDEPSAVAANLQVNGGDLLEMSLVLKTAIMEAAKSSHSVAELRELQSFVDTYVKISRQADRILRLKHEIIQSPPETSVASRASRRHANE